MPSVAPIEHSALQEHKLAAGQEAELLLRLPVTATFNNRLY